MRRTTTSSGTTTTVYAFGLEEHTYFNAGANKSDLYYYSLGDRGLGSLDNNSKIVTLPKVIAGFPPERFIAKGYSGLEWLEVGRLKIPVDENVSALVPYRGAQGSFPYISLADVWVDNVPAEKLKGKIALIGTTAQGLFDLRSTPVAEVYPGVEIHANLIAGMLDGKLKQKPPYMLGAEVVLLVTGGVVLSLLIPMLAPLWATVAAVIGVALITLINLGVWSYAGSVLPLAASILMTTTLYTVNMAYGYFVEARSKRQFAELFGQYVPPELVDKMAEDPEKYNMEPRNAELTQNDDASYYDLGLCARTDLPNRPDLCGAFKVPSLRNVAIRHASTSTTT